MPIIIRQVESKGRKGRKEISMDQGMPKLLLQMYKRHEDKWKDFTNKVNLNNLELQYKVGFAFTGLCPSGLQQRCHIWVPYWG